MDGQLSEPERSRVHAHLNACSDCRDELRTLRWTQDLARQMPVMPVPRSFIVREADLEARRGAQRWPRLVPALAGLQTAAAIVAVLLVLVVAGDLWVGRRVPGDQSVPIVAMKVQATETVTLAVAAAEAIEAPSTDEQSDPALETQPIMSLAATTETPTSVATNVAELAPKAMAVPTDTPTPEPSATQTPTLVGFSSEVTSTGNTQTPVPTVTPAPAHTPTTEPTPVPTSVARLLPTLTSAPPPTRVPASEPTQLATDPVQLMREGDETEEKGPIERETPSLVVERPRSSWRFAQIGLGVALLGLLIAIVWLRRWGRFG